jgi:hypothetical protein
VTRRATDGGLVTRCRWVGLCPEVYPLAKLVLISFTAAIARSGCLLRDYTVASDPHRLHDTLRRILWYKVSRMDGRRIRRLAAGKPRVSYTQTSGVSQLDPFRQVGTIPGATICDTTDLFGQVLAGATPGLMPSCQSLVDTLILAARKHGI